MIRVVLFPRSKLGEPTSYFREPNLVFSTGILRCKGSWNAQARHPPYEGGFIDDCGEGYFYFKGITKEPQKSFKKSFMKSFRIAAKNLQNARSYPSFACSIIDIPTPDCHNKYRNGDIAQLGERCLRKAEAEGSNPFISTMTLMRAETLRVFYTYICLDRYDGRRETLG